MNLLNLKSKKKEKYSSIPIFLIISILPISFLLGTLVSEILLFATILTLAFNKKLLNNLKKNLSNNADIKILFIIYILLILNTFFSTNIESSFLRNFGFIRLIIYSTFLQLYLREYGNKNNILIFWTFVFLIVIFDLYYEYIFGQNILGFKSIDPLRLVSFLGEEEKIGTFIAGFFFPLLACWYYKIEEKKTFLYNFVFTIIILLILYIFLPIGQRSITIKIFIACTVFLIFVPRISKKIKLIFLFLSIVIMYIFISNNEKLKIRYYYSIFNTKNYIQNEESEKSKNIFHKFKKEYQSSHYWKHHFVAYKIFTQYPIFGVGNKNFRYKCFFVDVSSEHTKEKRTACSSHPHQLYYELLSEHGLLGIIIIFLFFIIFFRNFFLFIKDKSIYRLSFICYFIFIFIPLVPSGSFFTSYNIILFFTNFAFKDIKIKD